jgi:hypothetical protein
MLVLFTCQVILSNINAQNTLKWISIFVREKVAKGQVRVLHVPSRYQIADIFTKGLPLQLFEDFRDSLNIRQPPVSTTGAY